MPALALHPTSYLKQAIQGMLRRFGYELHKLRQPVASTKRPIGDVEFFLEDIKARGFRPAGFIDVGAHRGDWARMFLTVFPGTPGILIEPQSEMAGSLAELIRTQSRLRFVNAGTGAEEGELVQTIYSDYAGSTFLQPVDKGGGAQREQRRTKIVTIDSILQAPDSRDFRPDFVKLDIQGFELEALRGGESLFGTAEVFLVETSLFSFMAGQPTTRDVIEFMAVRGYEIYDLPGYMRRPSDGALGQVDLAFVRRNGKLRSSTEW